MGSIIIQKNFGAITNITAENVTINNSSSVSPESNSGSSSPSATNESQSQPSSVSPEFNSGSSSPAPDVRTELSPADKAILAVHNAGICEPSDWAAVIRLFKEREMMQPNGQPFDAAYINRVCGKPVTSESSISRSIMSTKIGGKYPYWRIKQDEETRQTPNKLRLYNEIGRIASEALQ